MSKAARGASPRWWRWVLILILILAVIPVIEVAAVRFVDPPITPLMLLRPVEARFAGHPSPPRQYTWLPMARVPHDFLKFALIAEDQRFFRHHGFDWREIHAAEKHAERTGQEVRGASTITMQCARSLFLWQERSWIRKGLEAYYTFWMEVLLSKRRILELYANVIEMGDGVYGIEAAAHAHYGVNAHDLNRDQCLALAAILPNPRGWDPRSPTPRLAARISHIQQQEKQVNFPQLSAR
ncbi:monofunctional biosynthetic peptidoglycan transglycosylase [Chthoniobacter flavus Ellin428]|uniref:Biosynthetic peptidoglycan transglycosylase n=1 Tax=Chthoniobacter flavus Ellin428 TaxID=497964 RepID=B4CUC5_9BACT|nr:monofunctional biosynthetic peptidoglycan transglycosylase [Chthoniobacter flavus]EDY22163.1 monofunctional biosynthetic peptidoglycan transglycosylase [Chthoniobacter flavus Ellin428]TCO94805.1 monofunctional biosynthetic peptidoglycan transglycosylase [Chthoniobacter flavus]